MTCVELKPFHWLNVGGCGWSYSIVIHFFLQLEVGLLLTISDFDHSSLVLGPE